MFVSPVLATYASPGFCLVTLCLEVVDVVLPGFEFRPIISSSVSISGSHQTITSQCCLRPPSTPPSPTNKNWGGSMAKKATPALRGGDSPQNCFGANLPKLVFWAKTSFLFVASEALFRYCASGAHLTQKSGTLYPYRILYSLAHNDHCKQLRRMKKHVQTGASYSYFQLVWWWRKCAAGYFFRTFIANFPVCRYTAKSGGRRQT